jgi:hypothetical protein
MVAKEVSAMNGPWSEIISYVKQKPIQSLLIQRSNTQQFEISIGYDSLILNFQRSHNKLRLEKSRFISAYNMLKERKGSWVSIGGSRVNTKADTLEGRIKNEFNRNMNGLSTAPWIAAILVGAFDNIIFNEQMMGQAIKMI